MRTGGFQAGTCLLLLKCPCATFLRRPLQDPTCLLASLSPCRLSTPPFHALGLARRPCLHAGLGCLLSSHQPCCQRTGSVSPCCVHSLGTVRCSGAVPGACAQVSSVERTCASLPSLWSAWPCLYGVDTRGGQTHCPCSHAPSAFLLRGLDWRLVVLSTLRSGVWHTADTVCNGNQDRVRLECLEDALCVSSLEGCGLRLRPSTGQSWAGI